MLQLHQKSLQVRRFDACRWYQEATGLALQASCPAAAADK